MKIAALSLAAATLACTISVPSFSAVSGSGEIVTVTKDFIDFDRVEIGSAFDATVQQGDTFAIVIRIDDNLEEYLRVNQVGQTLELGLEPDRVFGLGSTTLEAEITMPTLSGVETSGASQITLAGFESSQSLRVVASGASSVAGEIQAGDTSMKASGASSISLAGGAANLALEVSGASSVDLEAFPVADLHAELSGASSAVVNVSGTLDVEASGASELSYLGNPTLGSVNTSGASSVIEK
ncbi:MAG: head GIN domain-containing protein [Anaerolineales bacterium]